MLLNGYFTSTAAVVRSCPCRPPPSVCMSKICTSAFYPLHPQISSAKFVRNIRIATSVCKSGYPLSGYPDFSVNFMATKNPDILKWKSGCFGCLQKLCKLCLWYCRGTLNYSEIDSPGSKEWMVSIRSLVGRLDHDWLDRGRLQAKPKRLCFTRVTHSIFSAVVVTAACPSVRLSHAGIVSKRLNLS